MENVVESEFTLRTGGQSREVGRDRSGRTKALKELSILDWYRILRVHHHLAIFQAIRFALWLSR
jgi:hypothetical protein